MGGKETDEARPTAELKDGAMCEDGSFCGGKVTGKNLGRGKGGREGVCAYELKRKIGTEEKKERSTWPAGHASPPHPVDSSVESSQSKLRCLGQLAQRTG